MDTLVTIVGIGVVVAVVRDVFHTIFHPIGRGSIAPHVMRMVWRLSGRLSRRSRRQSMAGPIGVMVVVVCWAAGAVVGWTLIYFAQMPDGFSYSPGLVPSARNDFFDAVYLSFVTVATLGFGDIVPTSASLRIAAPLEALFGFLLISAAVSWVLQVYPALHRRRVLALQLSTLQQARRSSAGMDINDIPVDVFNTLTTAVVGVRDDLTQFRESYYFRDPNADASLAANLHSADALAAQARASAHAQIRALGAALTAAVDRLAVLLDEQFLHVNADTANVVRAYAADHGYPESSRGDGR